MSQEFERSMEIVFKFEGGYANLANDEETNLGVRRSTYEAYLGRKVKDTTFKKLKHEDVVPIYREKYWIPSGADRVAWPLCLCLFDFAVHSGVGRAVKELQRVLGIPQDGVVGQGTMDAIRSSVNLPNRYLDAREKFIKSIKNFNLYGKGWLNRIQLLRKIANGEKE